MTTPFQAVFNTFRQSTSILTGLTLCVLWLAGCQAVNPSEESPQLRKAKQLIEQGNFEEAFVELNQALSQAPKDPSLHISLGWLYLYTNDLDNAAQELLQAETLGPDLAETYHLRGALLSHQAQHPKDNPQARPLQEEAIQNFKQALQRDPKNNQTYFDLATSLSAVNQNEAALSVLNQGFEYIPNKDLEMQVNFQIATCAAEAQLQRYDEAIEDCNQALSFTQNPASRERITDMIENMKLMNPGLADKLSTQQEATNDQAEENAVIESAASD